MDHLNLVEASISDLQAALSSGALTSVELVARYLHRISRYDCQGLALNSIPILNNHLFDEAAASDDRRRSGQPIRRLEGIPYTVKDSFKVKGMTAASGSPAFKDLVANDDAFTVAAIRAEGGVLIGRTNMPPMAYGGMQRGVYGRAESPYNPEYLAAAWASGSSNGSAVSTAASMAAFGMGEETVSSGRSPASNNALIAYTPSRGWISIRGNWPLYPTCDVVVPQTRTMYDMLEVLQVITALDPQTKGDFWRDQPFVKLSQPWGGSPPSFKAISLANSLKGLRIAVPDMYIGGAAPDGATQVYTSDGVKQLWDDAKEQLESLGATVIVVPDFPPVTAYENLDLSPADSARLPDNWHWSERGPMVGHGWDQFLRANADPSTPNLSSVDEARIWPHSMRTQAELDHFPMSNAIHWGKLAGYARENTMYSTANLESAAKALEAMRKRLLDDYLEQFGCHCVVFPSQGDVARSDSDVNPESAAHAWKNGVFYSNGNRALRHLGIPSVTVPMGLIQGKDMPVGLTFAGPAYQDEDLLKWANAFEKKTRLRTTPSHTPGLATDIIRLESPLTKVTRAERPALEIQSCECESSLTEHGVLRIDIKGTIATDMFDGEGVEIGAPVLQITVNAEEVPPEQINVIRQDGDNSKVIHRFEAWGLAPSPEERNSREKTLVPVARDKAMVVILARSTPNGYPTGYLGLV